MGFTVQMADSVADGRSFVERMFFDLKDGEKVAKEVLVVSCENETPKDSEIPDNVIVVMKKYKKSITKGKKDILQGKTVVYIPSEKGKTVLPLDQMAEFRDYLQQLEQDLQASSEVTEG